MNDTPENIDEVYRKMLMKLTGEKRILMSLSMFDLAAELMISRIKAMYTAKDFKKQIFLRMYDNDFTQAEKEKILLSIM
jgi:predicted kinase